MIRSVAVLVLAAFLLPALAAGRTRVSVSTPEFTLDKMERVSGFHVVVKKGSVKTLPRIPDGWRVKLVNSDDNTASLDATALSGVDAVRPNWFRDFVQVDLIEGGTLKVKIDTTEDWEKTRRTLTFEDAQLVKTPVS